MSNTPPCKHCVLRRNGSTRPLHAQKHACCCDPALVYRSWDEPHNSFALGFSCTSVGRNATVRVNYGSTMVHCKEYLPKHRPTSSDTNSCSIHLQDFHSSSRRCASGSLCTTCPFFPESTAKGSSSKTVDLHTHHSTDTARIHHITALTSIAYTTL